MIEVKIDVPKTREIQLRLGILASNAETVLYRAINDTMKHTRAEMNKEIKAKYATKTWKLNKQIKIKTASKSRLYGRLYSKDYKMPLYNFNLSNKDPVTYTKNGNSPVMYSANVRKTGSLKALTGRENFSKAFVAEFKSGHKGIFERDKKSFTKNKRNVLMELRGPALPQSLGKAIRDNNMEDSSANYFKKRIEAHINLMIARAIK